MQHWEYAQVFHTTDGGAHIVQVRFTHQDAWPDTDVLWPVLRALGDDGWELVAIVPGPNPENLVAYMKRPKPTPQAGAVPA